MRALAAETGITIEPVVAQLFPVEKRLAYLRRQRGTRNDTDSCPKGIEVTARDEAVIDLLLVKPEESDAWFQRMPERRKAPLLEDCERVSRKLSVQADGAVSLCCVTFDPRFRPGTTFLDHSHAEIQRSRYEHDFCRVCMKNGLHLLPGGVLQWLARGARANSRLARVSRGLLAVSRRLRAPAASAAPGR